jgi:hypothetical protein
MSAFSAFSHILQKFRPYRNRIIYTTIGIAIVVPFMSSKFRLNAYLSLRKTMGAFNTMDKCQKEFHKNNNSFKFFPDDYKTWEMFEELVNQNEENGKNISFSYMDPHDPPNSYTFNLEKDYRYRLSNLHNQISDHLCKIYLKNNMKYSHQKYIPESRIIKFLIEKPKLIEFIDYKIQTSKMVDIVLKKNEELVKFINPHLIIEMPIIETYPNIIKYIPKNDQTLTMAESIITKHRELSQYLRPSLREICAINFFMKSKNLNDLDGINMSGSNFINLMKDTKFKFVQSTKKFDPINVIEDDVVEFDMNNVKEIIVVMDEKKSLCRAGDKK